MGAQAEKGGLPSMKKEFFAIGAIFAELYLALVILANFAS